MTSHSRSHSRSHSLHALAPLTPSPSPSPSPSPLSFQRHHRRHDSLHSPLSPAPRSRLESWQRTVGSYWAQMGPTQRVVVVWMAVIGIVMAVLGVLYKDELLRGMVPIKTWMLDHPFSIVLLFLLTFSSAFPPMIGYSTSLTLSGFLYGFPHGWFLAAPATILGSFLSFHLCRHSLRSFTKRLLASDRRFAKLTATFHTAGVPLLLLLRLSPLPYSLSNGALALIPGVTPRNFLLATTFSTPKLLLHVFIGSRLALIAEEGAHMTPAVRMANWAGVILSAAVGVGGGWWVYSRMKAVAEGGAGAAGTGGYEAVGTEEEGAMGLRRKSEESEGEMSEVRSSGRLAHQGGHSRSGSRGGGRWV